MVTEESEMLTGVVRVKIGLKLIIGVGGGKKLTGEANAVNRRAGASGKELQKRSGEWKCDTEERK